MTAIGTSAGEHIVQLYQSDAELVHAVRPYLADGLRCNETAVVIATSGHRHAFEAALVDARIDLEQAKASGAFVALDAQETLSTFVRDHEIDREACVRVLRGLLDHAARRGRPLRLYGEMVALLWRQGDVFSALQLERVWNELACEREFSLFCAYEASVVSAPCDADALRQMHDLHTSTLSGSAPICGASEPPAGRERVFELSADRDAPHRARTLLLDALREWERDDESLADDAATVLGELAANAVLHVGLPFTVTVKLKRLKLLIEVSDRSAAVNGIVPRGMRGLGIVAAICSRWGVTHTASGKVVWGELPALA